MFDISIIPFTPSVPFPMLTPLQAAHFIIYTWYTHVAWCRDETWNRQTLSTANMRMFFGSSWARIYLLLPLAASTSPQGYCRSYLDWTSVIGAIYLHNGPVSPNHLGWRLTDAAATTQVRLAACTVKLDTPRRVERWIRTLMIWCISACYTHTHTHTHNLSLI